MLEMDYKGWEAAEELVMDVAWWSQAGCSSLKVPALPQIVYVILDTLWDFDPFSQ